MSKISKIILYMDDDFFFGIKRAPNNPAKDSKLELLGGGLDKGEKPLHALIRELKEEEESALLANKVAVLRPSPVEIVLEGDRHFIYHMVITKKELEGIRMSTHETYGYRLIPKATIITREGVERSTFTRRTVKIFDKLRNLRYFPYDVV
jgi:hypothetical protein